MSIARPVRWNRRESQGPPPRWQRRAYRFSPCSLPRIISTRALAAAD